MQATWMIVAQAVRHARQIVVIGYSRPGIDGATIELLKFSFRVAIPQRQLLIVDPNPAVIERYRAILGAEVTQVAAEFRDFDLSNL